MRTLALMSELDRLRDSYQDFVVVVPTRWHANGGGVAKMKIPWVSGRLFGDWYALKKPGVIGEVEEGRVGFSRTGKGFLEGIVGKVAKRAREGVRFTCGVEWGVGGEEQVVCCVPLRGGEENGGGGAGAWVCFIRGEFDLQS